MMGNWNYGYGFGWSWIFFDWILMIVFLALIAWAVISFIRWKTKDDTRARRDSVINILEERYARGEISKEEFEERKRVLRNEVFK